MDSQTAHILVVEDNPTYQLLVEFALSQRGFRVAVQAEAAKALVVAKEQHFDLAIVDYYLPDYRGPTFVQMLREVDGYTDVPVIVVTARPDDLNVSHLRDTLSVEVVPKMRGVKELLDTVSKCLAAAGCES